MRPDKNVAFSSGRHWRSHFRGLFEKSIITRGKKTVDNLIYSGKKNGNLMTPFVNRTLY